jgi:site-specific recombinase XerD
VRYAASDSALAAALRCSSVCGVAPIGLSRTQPQVWSNELSPCEAADLGIKTHAHMLRHSTGFKLANDARDTRSIQSYMGHKNIQNTTRYTALAPNRFRDFWSD